ncbi:hypothetical protein [Duncaniella freteri]|uniref:hypothetical protein n=1 Tax=Duncaniella freteri TaxID=2530391 RepID=UPI003F6745BE
MSLDSSPPTPILDIFGYSNELPLRIDFFVTKLTLSVSNIETQLSEQKANEVSITSGIASESSSADRC